MKYRNKVVCAVKEYNDPITDHEENNIPKYLPTGENSAAKKAILDQKDKLYVTKESEIKNNICKMYLKNCWQCTDTLQSIIGNEKGYEEKGKKNYLKWLLKTIKEISSGLEKLGNMFVS